MQELYDRIMMKAQNTKEQTETAGEG